MLINLLSVYNICFFSSVDKKRGSPRTVLPGGAFAAAEIQSASDSLSNSAGFAQRARWAQRSPRRAMFRRGFGEAGMKSREARRVAAGFDVLGLT